MRVMSGRRSSPMGHGEEASVSIPGKTARASASARSTAAVTTGPTCRYSIWLAATQTEGDLS